jgi:cell wall-associated NlpC family hydrolase
VCSITEAILTEATRAVNRPTCLKSSENRLLAAIALLGAAVLAAGCGAARRPPQPYPGPPPPAAVFPALAEPAAEAPSADSAGEAVASFALSLQGSPYVNGGAGLDGFDCSGFVQYVFAQSGVTLPRSVLEQFAEGTGVDGIPEAGDLVFFAIDGDRVSHVGIATGPDTFVHAPSSRGVVREDRLSAPYWSRRYAGARRVLPYRGAGTGRYNSRTEGARPRRQRQKSGTAELDTLSKRSL